MYAYADLNTIKSQGMLDITTLAFDTQLVRIAEAASRQIDKYTDRYFYIYEGTKYQDGGGNRVVLDFDLQSITSGTTGLTVDADGDHVYESAYTVDINSPTTAPDCFAYPLNIYPKTRLEINNNGNYGSFGSGVRAGIKILGTFGYGADWPDAYSHTVDSTVGGALTSTATAVSVTASTAAELSAGMTIKVNSEQCYINAQPTGSSCPITRAQNGTSAAAATTGTAISVFDYPSPIVQATVIQTIRAWKRRESAYQTVVASPELGTVNIYRGIDPDVKEIIREYRRERVPNYW